MNLEEEIIWGHKVTSQTKKLWSIEIDLAEKLLDVCNKHSLKIWTCYGTLIGAVRHKGFIPWDDDMDFVMFRDDYEKLQKIAKSEFSYPYFFQSIYTDAFWGGMSRLRRSDTTMIENGYQNYKECNRGIWIDIFVLDGIPADEAKFRNSLSRLKILRRVVNNYKTLNPKALSIATKTRHRLISIFCRIVGYSRIQQYIVRRLSANRIDECKKVAPVDMGMIWGDVGQAKALEKVWFHKTVMLPFHEINVPAPQDYDKLLSLLYGDYMKPVKGIELHLIETVDCEKSYSDVINEKQIH